MLKLERHHDFQVFISPKNKEVSSVNPPSFNWPQKEFTDRYTVEIKDLEKNKEAKYEEVASPFQLKGRLEEGNYQWRITDSTNESTEWFNFSIDSTSVDYLAPTAKELFKLAENRDQFLMYFDEDIDLVKEKSQENYEKFKLSASMVDVDKITYPTNYRRGLEEGKRTAITNVREWIDRDLVSLTLLYKIWGEEESGETAVKLLLKLAEWSPEGPASLLRPCTWGDEVGLSLSRNLFLAYHWLAPLLTESEKWFIRPMLVRIGYQLEQRLEEDMFKQFPGHSHTSRLPAYLGIAALALHKEYDQDVCERWLNYATMIYKGILPFYGGKDGSWAEGAFYSSSYSKWTHPFFLAVERLSDFSFYNHPFYRNYHNFAMDFVAPNNEIHPFGDGFWCRRDGNEWPGFFSQNPLRIYADRFGDKTAKETSQKLEDEIDWYRLHLLDVIPTVKQLEAAEKADNKENTSRKNGNYNKYYEFAGFGKAMLKKNELYFRASQFGNSSHRHGDQGNIAFIDAQKAVLTPSGSYGYKFGSGHHKEWTRTTKAHNLPLIDQVGQILDNESATASVVSERLGSSWYFVQLDLSKSYVNTSKYIRNIIMVQEKGMIICDRIELKEEGTIQWRLHSHLDAVVDGNNINLSAEDFTYKLGLLSDKGASVELAYGYNEDKTHGQKVTSDAPEDVYHIEWNLAKKKNHSVIACCAKNTLDVKVEGSILNIDLGGETLTLNVESSQVEFKTK